MTTGFRKQMITCGAARRRVGAGALLFNGFFGIFCSNFSLTRPR
jgi:hypothetical protein